MMDSNDDDLPLNHWNQETNFGRDLFIEVSTPAEIVPFQIKCTLVQVGERGFGYFEITVPEKI